MAASCTSSARRARQQRTDGDGGRLGPQHVRSDAYAVAGRRPARTAPTRPRGRRARSGGAATARRPSRSASAAPGRPATSANVADPVDLRQPGPAALHGRLAGDVGQPSGLPVGLGRRPTAPRRARRRTGSMRSMPSSVSFCTVSSGRSPLTRANATVIGGAGRGSATTSPAASRSGPAPSRAARQRPAPSPTVTGSPGRSRSDPGQVVVVGRRQARRVEVVDERMGARGEWCDRRGRRRARPPYLNAERILDIRPLGGGATGRRAARRACGRAPPPPRRARSARRRRPR